MPQVAKKKAMGGIGKSTASFAAVRKGSTRKRAAEDLPKSAKKRKLIAGCPIVSPEEAGLSKTPLERCRAIVHEEVHELGSLPGVAHVVIMNGRCVFTHVDGWSNLEAGTKFGLNTLCALHSCTKPLVVAAFLTLLDEGKVRLSDPIEKFIPFADHVRTENRTRKVRKRATLHHLLTQVAGVRHADEAAYKPIVSRLKRKKITNISGFCDELATVPLQSEPGAMHFYSVAIDVLGRVCEVVSGKDLERFVTESLLQPLGMVDTHFVIPPSKLRRTAGLYNCTRALHKNKGKSYCARLWHGPKMHPGLFSSGGGMLSYADAGMYGTAEDYARFCQMLLNDGRALDGRQILRKKTARLLFQDSLTPFAKSDGRVPGWNDFGGDDPKEVFYWDRHDWSLLNATIDLEEPPKQSGPPRRGVAHFGVAQSSALPDRGDFSPPPLLNRTVSVSHVNGYCSQEAMCIG